MATKSNRDEIVPDDTSTSWGVKFEAANTKCKHGYGSCTLCGTRNETDIIHTARTPNKREMRRKRRKVKP